MPGAIYSSNGAIANLTNCTFENSTSYRNNDTDLYSYNNAQYIINNINATKDNNLTNVTIAYGKLPTLIERFIYGMEILGSAVIDIGIVFFGTVSGGTFMFPIFLIMGEGMFLTLLTMMTLTSDVNYQQFKHPLTTREIDNDYLQKENRSF